METTNAETLRGKGMRLSTSYVGVAGLAVRMQPEMHGKAITIYGELKIITESKARKYLQK